MSRSSSPTIRALEVARWEMPFTSVQGLSSPQRARRRSPKSQVKEQELSLSTFSQPHCLILLTWLPLSCLIPSQQALGTTLPQNWCRFSVQGANGLFQNVNGIVSYPVLETLWWLPITFTITFKRLTLTAEHSTPPQPLSLSLQLSWPWFSTLSLSIELFSSCHLPLLPSEAGQLWCTGWLAFVMLL